MANRSLSLFPNFSDPLFTDRFSRIDKLFSHLTGDVPLQTAPSYDIIKLDENRYGMVLSVPGWKEDELEIEMMGRALTIAGKREQARESDNNSGWLHRGINRSNFSFSYALPEHVKVQKAHLENGLLTVELYQEIPESAKPQKIAIESQNKEIPQAIEHHTN